MIKVQGKLPKKLTVACSGGVDSIAALDFLHRKHDVDALFIHHHTPDSINGFKAVHEYCSDKDIRVNVAFINKTVPQGVSQEEHWRNERYRIFHKFSSFSPDAWEDNKPSNIIVTCHHLDDCIETWVWSSLNGEGKIIPHANKNVIRPFRLTKKEEFVKWAKQNDLAWAEDESNSDTKHIRNYIRHEMMPHVLHVNAGIAKVIRKKIANEKH